MRLVSSIISCRYTATAGYSGMPASVAEASVTSANAHASGSGFRNCTIFWQHALFTCTVPMGLQRRNVLLPNDFHRRTSTGQA